ncbi:hypothetical protein B0O80DRAFT_493779 [Mortierella sp. GBAus27b]|nr:hypothetical protein B0O80DRAFT_493779 [Mortierella sp. GBAus27b]
MPLFKPNNNKSASAVSTPAQTPRSSMQDTRPKATTLNPEEALQNVMKKSIVLDPLGKPFGGPESYRSENNASTPNLM